MERDIMEIMTSQQMMLQRYKKTEDSKISLQLMEKFKASLDAVSEWIEKNKTHVEILRISYSDLVSHPQDYVDSIRKFLNVELDGEKMFEVIDRSLHRVKTV